MKNKDIYCVSEEKNRKISFLTQRSELREKNGMFHENQENLKLLIEIYMSKKDTKPEIIPS